MVLEAAHNFLFTGRFVFRYAWGVGSYGVLDFATPGGELAWVWRWVARLLQESANDVW